MNSLILRMPFCLQDAHNAILDFDTNSSLFAVYDGHGGHEVAVYTAKHLPKYIRKNELYRKGQMDEALVESFVEFDRTITRSGHKLNYILLAFCKISLNHLS